MMALVPQALVQATDLRDQRGRRRCLAALAAAPLAAARLPLARATAAATAVPILVYHRFAADRLDGMTVRTTTFDAHLRVLRDTGCAPVPLSAVVDAFTGVGPPLPPRAVALTADDGHRSQFELMAPRLAEHGWPATLFVYPSAVSNAGYAMTWEQLRTLVARPGFTVQSHTYWHPNLLRERQRLAPDAFERFATDQLVRSRQRLEQQLRCVVSLLAWPFGLADAGLMALARQLGYRAAFTLDHRYASAADPVMALPRQLVTDDLSARGMAALVSRSFNP
jgi:peptidoglycan/xylan/chitin deacetylase (PgdA/CDA1 family)